VAKTMWSVRYHDVEIEYAGNTYRGTYHIESGVITVTSGVASRSAHIGSFQSRELATLLLGELVTRELSNPKEVTPELGDREA